jgi:MFS family permease
MAMPGRQVRGLIAATSTIAVFGITVGLAVPLLTLVLEKQGYGEGLIGLNAAAQFLGIMGFAPLAPRAIRRFGLFRLMAGCLVICAACLALLPVFNTYGAWLVIRLLFGGAEGLLFVAAETWVNQTVDDRVRGRMVALYGTTLAAGFAVGPLIITVTGIDDSTPFVIGVALVLAGLGPLFLGAGAAPPMVGAPTRGLLAIVRAIPIAVAASLLFGLLDGGLIALLAVYGLAISFDTAGAAQLVTVLVVGGIFLQLPIGWLADRTDRVLVLIGCGFIGAAILAAIPLATETLLLHALLFGLGGLLGSYWTLSMAILGARFQDGDLAAGNVGLTLAYGIGSVAGPAIGGFAMELWRPHGLMVVLAVFSAGFALVGLALRRKAD